MSISFGSIMNLFSFFCNHTYDLATDKYDENDNDKDEEDQTANLILTHSSNGDASMKKPITLDENRSPYSKMKLCLADDVKVYAKDLDPKTSWKCQPTWERQPLFECLYASMPLHSTPLF